jgi:hypothetical protein
MVLFDELEVAWLESKFLSSCTEEVATELCPAPFYTLTSSFCFDILPSMPRSFCFHVSQQDFCRRVPPIIPSMPATCTTNHISYCSLWRVYPFLGIDTVNTLPRQRIPARNNRGGVTIRDAYSRCYVEPAAHACTVTWYNNRWGDAGGVFCRSAWELYNEDLTQLQFELGRVLGTTVEGDWE